MHVHVVNDATATQYLATAIMRKRHTHKAIEFLYAMTLPIVIVTAYLVCVPTLIGRQAQIGSGIP